jgi:hypothetical protein
MSNKSSLSSTPLSTIIFRNHANASLPTKFLSLFPGLGYAAGYKIAQRVYKFGGQPWFRDLIEASPIKPVATEYLGEKKGKMVIHAAAGSLTGIGEVVLLPLDVLKIKMQTNPDAIKGRGLAKLLREEGVASLYRGWGWTMGRNAPGSFAVSRTYLGTVDEAKEMKGRGEVVGVVVCETTSAHQAWGEAAEEPLVVVGRPGQHGMASPVGDVGNDVACGTLVEQSQQSVLHDPSCGPRRRRGLRCWSTGSSLEERHRRVRKPSRWDSRCCGESAKGSRDVSGVAIGIGLWHLFVVSPHRVDCCRGGSAMRYGEKPSAPLHGKHGRRCAFGLA